MAPENGRRASVTVEVTDLHKSFRIPTHRVDTLKERALHPFARLEFSDLEALRGISFSVRGGEVMGIVGRNGSGKTTLLKLLASIYRADRGTIRVAGTLAPFIELGVGFNLNLTARDNVLLNGVMMGLSPMEARRRFDEVIEFAELEDFVEMKLKNYSSGMAMRLAFSVMAQSDAEVMLIDEVLAVGDAAFAQKCVDSFHRLRDAGRTILFVTHDMESMRSLCDEAILIDDGLIEIAGDPDAVARRYFQLNFEKSGVSTGSRPGPASAVLAGRITDSWIENEAGERNPEGFEHGAPIRVFAELEASADIEEPRFSFDICSTDGTRVFATPLDRLGGSADRLVAGERLRYAAEVANPLAPGSYKINCVFCRNSQVFDIVDLRRPLAKLVVWGDRQLGVVDLDWDSRVERESDARDVAR